MLGGFNYKIKERTTTTTFNSSARILSAALLTTNDKSLTRPNVNLPVGQLDDIIVIICFQSVKH